jgi:hypothetical protein
MGLAIILGSLLLCSAEAWCCSSDRMKTTDAGFIFKVVGGADMIEATTEPGGRELAFTLAAQKPYFVVCEEDRFYKLSDVAARSVERAATGKFGYVAKDQVHPWPTREALEFSPATLGGDRAEVVAWNDLDTLRKFLETGDAKASPPARRDDLRSLLRRERLARPYPVLGSTVAKLRGAVDKRVFNVLLPETLPDARLVIEPETDKAADGKEGGNAALAQKLEKTMARTTVVFAYDETSDMERMAHALAQQIKAAADALPKEIQDALRIGFVFFRDENDEEKYLIIEPQNVANALNALSYAARPGNMIGGGDPAEPVLDAVYIAQHFYPWDDAGRRLVVAVLGDDAKPTTLGKIHEGVPAGMGPETIAADLAADGIKVIAVQNFPNAGPNLIPVLSTLGESTGGMFIPWGSDGDPARGVQVAAILAAHLTTIAKETFADARQDLSILQFDDRGRARLPLGSFDGEKLGRLRAAGIKFHVDAGKAGTLVREGYLIGNDELFEPVIQIDKPTLERLIALFGSFGIASIDADAMKECAGQVMAAISGEDYDPRETMDVAAKKQLGLQFRTKLLDFNIEYLAGMNRDERLAMARRIQDGARVMAQFLDAHQAELDRTPVWMPVSLLP